MLSRNDTGRPGALSMEVGLAAGNHRLYEWIRSSAEQTSRLEDGVILGSAPNGKTLSAIEFTNAKITGVAFPGLDPRTKDVGRIKVDLWAAGIRSRAGDGKACWATPARRWVSSDFSLAIDNRPCDVVRIEPFHLVRVNSTGRTEDPVLRVAFSSQEMMLAGESWRSWLTTPAAKTGVLKLLSRDGSAIATLSFQLDLLRLHEEHSPIPVKGPLTGDLVASDWKLSI